MTVAHSKPKSWNALLPLPTELAADGLRLEVAPLNSLEIRPQNKVLLL
jgi:hypothetical protein